MHTRLHGSETVKSHSAAIFMRSRNAFDSPHIFPDGSGRKTLHRCFPRFVKACEKKRARSHFKPPLVILFFPILISTDSCVTQGNGNKTRGENSDYIKDNAILMEAKIVCASLKQNIYPHDLSSKPENPGIDG